MLILSKIIVEIQMDHQQFGATRQMSTRDGNTVNQFNQHLDLKNAMKTQNVRIIEVAKIELDKD